MTQEAGGNKSRSSAWRRCPPGEFERLAERLRTRRQRRHFLRTAGAVAASIAAGGGLLLWNSSRPSGMTPPGGLTCDEVQQFVAAYAAGKLDEPTRQRVREHVSKCPRCGPRFQAMGLNT